jgi:hypothetical protein
VAAKEELHDEVERLTEQEAADLLRRIREAPVVEQRLEAEQQASDLRAFFERWRGRGVMTEDEWNDFARDFDAQRPHRPLFT